MLPQRPSSSRLLCVLSLLGAAVLLPLHPAHAATITTPLPGFVGTFSPNLGLIGEGFDVGTAFTEISDASLHIVGVESGASGLLTFLFTFAAKFPFVPFPDGPFDLTQPVSFAPGTPPSLDFLLPGTGTLLLDFRAPCIICPPPEVALSFSQVDLIITGTPIPEPTTALLLGAALAALLALRRGSGCPALPSAPAFETPRPGSR